jgi:hypothetical protein
MKVFTPVYFVVNLRPDFCGKGKFFFKRSGLDASNRRIDYGTESKFTAKVTTKIIAAANPIDEAAAGAYG